MHTRDSHNEERIQSLLSTARTSSARSIFLAGYSFTRLRLYATAESDDTAFIVLICLSFNFALLSAALSLLFVFFLELCPKYYQQLRFAELSSKTLVLPAYASFIFALITFCLGMSRIGFVNFTDSSFKNAPFVIFLVTCVLIILTQIYMISLLHERPSEDNAEEEQSSSRKNKSFTISGILSSQLATERSGEKLEVFLMKQIAVIAERAVFVAGFAVNGMSFYVDSTDEDNWHHLDKVYLVCVCVAATCALYVCSTMSSAGVLLEHASDANGMRVLFANQIYPLCAVCLLVYTIAFWALGVAIVFLGWGHAYTQDRMVCSVIGLCAIVAMVMVAWWVIRCHSVAVATARTGRSSTFLRESLPTTSQTQPPDGDKIETGMSAIEDTAADKDFVTITLQKNAKIGGIAIITSGFVFITMLFYGSYSTKSRHYISASYLSANCLSVVLCLVIAISDSLVQLFTNDLSTFRQRRQFLDNMKPVFIATRLGSMLAFITMIISFSLVGIVRFQPDSYEPLFAGSLTGLLLVGGTTFLYVSYNSVGDKLQKFAAQKQERTVNSQDTEEGQQSSSTPAIDPSIAHRVPRRPLQLSLMGGCALFFGGYAYNTVINMAFSRTKIDISFVAVMSLVFLCSIVVTAWAAMYVIAFLSCSSPKEKFVFTMLTGPFYNTGIGMALVSMVAVTVGFSLLGYTKTTTDQYKSFSLTLIGATVLGVCLVVGILYRIVQIYIKDVYAIFKQEQKGTMSDERESAAASDTKEYRPRFITQISATTVSSAFVGGNILYELLFVKPIFGRFPETINYIFFVLAACTFVSATSVVVLSNITLFWVNSLPDAESERLCKHLYKAQINWFVLYFSLSAILTWIGSVSMQPHVTYLHSIDQRWPNTAICMVTLVVVTLAVRKAFKNVELASGSAGTDITGVVLTPMSAHRAAGRNHQGPK